MAQKFIHIKGARANNLKNIEVKIPHGKMTVITGMSGSGKSTLAFDTLYAEGQRRYVESLSSYARQFLGRFDKPETDFIKGIAPAIAIEQKVISNNPRSTVGTTTEIYDYLKIFFARVGKTYSPISGNVVKKDSVTDVVNYCNTLPENSKVLILCPLTDLERFGSEKLLKLLIEQGFTRLFHDNELISIDEIDAKIISKESTFLVIDRMVVTTPEDDSNVARFADSASLAFIEGNGNCGIFEVSIGNMRWFTNLFELDGMTFTEPTEYFFTFNNPVGACKICEGYGNVLGIDQRLVIPDPSLSIYEGAIACWRTPSHKFNNENLINAAKKHDIPIHKSWIELTEDQKDLIFSGTKDFTGIFPFFQEMEKHAYTVVARVFLSRYRGKSECRACKGTRLRKDASYVKIEGKSIVDIVKMPVDKCFEFFSNLELEGADLKIAKRILPEIQSRLQFLCDVGLGYLTLNRQAGSLSGGESQRINLATSLGSSLVGSMYILDEPSIGLHPRDTQRLIKVLHSLRDLGNTVIVVEHEEEIMRAADEIIDIGPKAGKHGGEVVFQGDHVALMKDKKSLTGQYLQGKKSIEVPIKRRKSNEFLAINKGSMHNVVGVSANIPLNCLVCVTGVSGSGKSSLINEILIPNLKILLESGDPSANGGIVTGSIQYLHALEYVDQNPIGRSSRSNPASYIGAYDLIRDVYASQHLARSRSYRPGFFSFNVDGGRCEMCEGEGTVTVGMQFMADVQLECEACKGTRFKEETLEVEYGGKNIYDILRLDIETAIDFFTKMGSRVDLKIVEKLMPLKEVGLGYLEMGQSSSTLSGGEAQRVKLASFIVKSGKHRRTLFIFDEPTTGLHFGDIELLILAFNRLIADGHSVIVIEHNLDVVKTADWVIDMGPEGGDKGGKVVFQGTPEALVEVKGNHTALYLKDKISSKEK